MGTGKTGENGQTSKFTARGFGRDRRLGMSGPVPTEWLPDRYRLGQMSVNHMYTTAESTSEGLLNAESGHGEPQTLSARHAHEIVSPLNMNTRVTLWCTVSKNEKKYRIINALNA